MGARRPGFQFSSFRLAGQSTADSGDRRPGHLRDATGRPEEDGLRLHRLRRTSRRSSATSAFAGFSFLSFDLCHERLGPICAGLFHHPPGLR